MFNRHAFPEEYRSIAADRALGDELVVLWSVPGSPAEAAGLAEGDVVVSVDGVEIGRGEEALARYREILSGAARAAESAMGAVPIRIGVARDGLARELVVEAEPACDYPVVAALDPLPNAFADGERVLVNSGMIRLLESPEDLQVIIGHEIAHNVKGHPAMGGLGALVGLALDIAADTPPGPDGGFTRIVPGTYSATLEAEADYVGLYIAAASGVDIDDAPALWRRIGAEFGGSKERGLLASHPASPERYLALKATIEEIDVKRASGRPLDPEPK